VVEVNWLIVALLDDSFADLGAIFAKITGKYRGYGRSLSSFSLYLRHSLINRSIFSQTYPSPYPRYSKGIGVVEGILALMFVSLGVPGITARYSPGR
jgi:hypothetical protein